MLPEQFSQESLLSVGEIQCHTLPAVSFEQSFQQVIWNNLIPPPPHLLLLVPPQLILPSANGVANDGKHAEKGHCGPPKEAVI